MALMDLRVRVCGSGVGCEADFCITSKLDASAAFVGLSKAQMVEIVGYIDSFAGGICTRISEW